MSSLIRIVNKVPDYLFNQVSEEVSVIDWNNLPIPDSRRLNPVFSTSITNHLRVHALVPGVPRTRVFLSDIVECVDTSIRGNYKSVNDLINWIMAEVNGEKLGRIMIVNLLPGGEVANHIDTGLYFQSHHRFHVPIKTNESVLFTGPNDTTAHMPTGSLSQLNNRDLHGVKNLSSTERYHVIVDIASSDPRFTFS
jgi:hypothetical protein